MIILYTNKGATMLSCPNCYIYKGTWIPMTEKEGVFYCKDEITHKFKRDKDGNFHSVV